MAMSCLTSPLALSLPPLQISVRRNYSHSLYFSHLLPYLSPSLLSSLLYPGYDLLLSHSLFLLPLFLFSLVFMTFVSRIHRSLLPARPLAPLEAADFHGTCENLLFAPPETSTQDTVEHLPTDAEDVSSLMKMERKSSVSFGTESSLLNRWFPYLDEFRFETTSLNSFEVLEAVGPCILESRKDRFRNALDNRSYSLCLVVEGLSDFSNVSAACRSADAIGVQSVHVISCDNSKRYEANYKVSMGAEKWLDIEIWNSTSVCFEELKSHGYRIVTSHLGTDAVSIHNIDWSCPTAIVVGNAGNGISDEALELSDMRCIIRMQGMAGSFNFSVAASMLMHGAVCDRISCLGSHGDLSLKERQILLSEFYLRHSKSATTVADEYAKRKAIVQPSKL